MNKKQAEIFIQELGSDRNQYVLSHMRYHTGIAEGYLEAIKKAEMLEECIDGLICGTCDEETAEEVLRKWRGEK